MAEKYPSSLTDAEWDIVRHFIPAPIHWRNLEVPKHARRDVVDAILYRERTGCQWRSLPHDFPPWKQVFEYYRKWRDKGVIKKLHDKLRAMVRAATPHADGSRRADDPTVCIMDSQSAKGSEEAVEARGFDAGKKVKGRKRHLVIDALGLLLGLQVTSASVQDRDAAVPMFRAVTKEFPSLEVAFLDGAYRGDVKSAIEESTGLHVEISLRSDCAKKRLRSNSNAVDRGADVWLVESLPTSVERVRAHSGFKRM